MESLSPHLLIEKSDLVFDGVKCTATLFVASGVVLKIIDYVSCCSFNAHENNTDGSV